MRDLCNRFGTQTVHEHLDLDVYKGEILGVVGGSGTGKSVLLRSIVGLRRPTEGQVRVFGQDLMSLDEQARSMVERRFGVLFQMGALFSSLTVKENIALRLIEVDKADLADLPDIVDLVAARPERFIIFCDDLSFEEGESGYKAVEVAAIAAAAIAVAMALGCG